MPEHQNKAIFVDFGTTSNKCQAYVDGQYTDRVLLSNQIYEITEEMRDGLKQKFQDSNLPVGLFTERDLVDGGLTGHAKEIPVQTGAVTFDHEKLTVAYRNTFEQLEGKLGVNILTNPNEWCIASALALPESEEVQKSLAEIHKKVLFDMGFGGVYLRNQPFFDIVGNIKQLSRYMTSPFTCTVLNIGGGDCKVVCVSKEPMPSTVKRESIGGIDVIEHARKIMEETLSVPVMSTKEIREWLIEWGDTEGQADEREVFWKGKKLQIRALLDSPRMLFEPGKFTETQGKRSITQVVIDSLESARLKGKDILIPHLVHCILVTGGGSLWGGVLERLRSELCSHFTELTNEINLIPSNEAVWSTLNGMVSTHSTKVKKGDDLDWVL